MCVFKVEKLCLAGNVKHMDRGEDRQWWLCVCSAVGKVNDLKEKRLNNYGMLKISRDETRSR